MIIDYPNEFKILRNGNGIINCSLLIIDYHNEKMCLEKLFMIIDYLLKEVIISSNCDLTLQVLDLIFERVSLYMFHKTYFQINIFIQRVIVMTVRETLCACGKMTLKT